MNFSDARNSTKLVVLFTVGMKDIVVSEFCCKTNPAYYFNPLKYMLKKTEKQDSFNMPLASEASNVLNMKWVKASKDVRLTPQSLSHAKSSSLKSRSCFYKMRFSSFKF